jgi:hypothetical protein
LRKLQLLHKLCGGTDNIRPAAFGTLGHELAYCVKLGHTQVARRVAEAERDEAPAEEAQLLCSDAVVLVGVDDEARNILDEARVHSALAIVEMAL